MEQSLALAEQHRQAALAITDIGNISGAIKFFKSALKPSGKRQHAIQPLLGAQIYVRSSYWQTRSRVLMLVQDQRGYKNLCALISQSYNTVSHADQAVIDIESLSPKQLEGLFVLSGHADGDLGALLLAGFYDKAQSLAKHWQSLVSERYVLELQWADRPGEAVINEGSLALSLECGIAVVATHPILFAKSEDYLAHEVRFCIANDDHVHNPERIARHTPKQYFLSSEAMIALFADTPQAITNTVRIAQSCTFLFDFLTQKNTTYHLPNFPTPHGEPANEWLTARAQENLAQKLIDHFPDEPVRLSRTQEYQERLAFELATIIKMGFSGYYLIVAEFIVWAKRQRIPVGPGRGSGAGSLVAYVMGITNIDPIAHGLLFERFLNPERISMPDFDIDFCEERRAEVIEHVRELYGSDCVSQIITFMTMGARSAIRDCARVLGLSLGAAGALADLIPAALDMTLDKARLAEPQIERKLKEEPALSEVWEMAKALEGLPRNVGVHAAGILITPSALINFCPLYRADESSRPAAQFDMKDIEVLGLVKFDFLGLSTLTVIQHTVEHIQMLTGKDFNIETIPESDPQTYRIFQSGDTNAIFQSESRTAKELERKIHPDNFEEITALMALNRPGPLSSGMVDDYIDIKHGKKTMSVGDERLREILAPTYGVIIYQEQVMQIAQRLANYTLGGADMLRRAMGKKDAELMAQNKESFIQGAVANRVESKVAKDLFELIEKFADYGFNKSHSAAYAVIAYQTAYLKAHYPSAFMAAVMTNEIGRNSKIAQYLIDCRAMGLVVLPPSINHGQYAFVPRDAQTIHFGLGAIKGLGYSAIQAIVQERQNHGDFRDVSDFFNRLDKTLVNKKAQESLIKSGALDVLGGAYREHYLSQINQQIEQSGGGLFDDAPSAESTISNLPKTFSRRQNLQWEHEVLEFYLSGHLMDYYRPDLVALGVPSIQTLAQMNAGQEKVSWVGGLITSARIRKTANGLMMSATLDDGSGVLLDLAVFSKVLEKIRDSLKEGKVILVYGRVSIDASGGEEADKFAGMPRMRAELILPFAQVLGYASALQVFLRSANDLQSLNDFLAAIRTPTNDAQTLDIYAEWLIAQKAQGALPAFTVRPTIQIQPSQALKLAEEPLLHLREQWLNQEGLALDPTGADLPKLIFRPLPNVAIEKRWS